MNKKIIPRKDHEVYFIPLPKDVKPKQIHPFVAGQMDRLHPGFSSACALDLRRFVFGETRWIMATIMKAETLAEYRILNKGAVFYTNTSIMARKKEFTRGGIQVIDDERIGFDAEKNEPVSIPLEPGKGEMAMPDRELKAAPPRCGVFTKRMARRRIPAIIVCTAAMVSLVSALAAARRNQAAAPKSAAPVLPETSPAGPETRFRPSPLEILAGFSADIVKTGGRIERWQYNEDSDPLMTIRLQGISARAAHEICGPLEYAYLEEIGDVKYLDGEPCITLFINPVKAGYAMPVDGTFPAQISALPMIVELTEALGRREISIASEVLPAPARGDNFYTIAYTAKGGDLAGSLETIAAVCGKYRMRVKDMDVSFGDNRFAVACSLTPGGRDSPGGIAELEGKENIPLAFGYKAAGPSPAPRAGETAKAGSFIVGSIKDGEARRVFFRDTAGGKILVRVGNE